MERLMLVDLLRTVSIALVLAVHLHGSGRIDTHASGRWNALAENGSYGVYVFFVLSGFLISRQIFANNFNLRSDVIRFWLRRVARIWPLVGLTCVIGAVMLTLADSDALQFCFRRVNSRFDATFWLSIPTFTLNWLRIARSNVVGGWGLHWDILWSLAIEEQFYLLYPLLVLFARPRWKLLLALTSLLVAGGLFDVFLFSRGQRSFLWLTTNSAMGFASLALGCLAFLAHARLRTLAITRHLRWPAFGFGTALAVAAYLKLSLADPRFCIAGPLLVSLGVALMTAFCADLLGTYREGQPRAWLVLPGKLSFACYLLHPLALFLLWQPLTGRNVWLAFTALGVVTVALAQASWHWFEEPSRKAILRRLLPPIRPR
jgi:peptidoglycan/LPS O-acetylase OafA/YrhL